MKTVLQHHPPVFKARRVAARCIVGAVAMLLGTVVRPASAIAAGDPQGDYAALFGEEEKKVMSTSSTKDDAAFAAKLLTKAAELKDAPDLQRFMYARAMVLGQKDNDGIDTAVEAAKRLVVVSLGADKLTWQSKLTDLYALQYRRATGQKRFEAGEFLLNVLSEEIEALTEQGKYADALKRLKEGQSIASSIRSTRADEFSDRVKEMTNKQSTADRLEKLRTKMGSQGGDVALLEQIILGYYLELENSTVAMVLSAQHPNKEWERMLKLASTPVKDLKDAELGELADWCLGQSEKAMPAHKIALLGKSQSLYRQFLVRYPKKDAQALRMQEAMERANKSLAAAAPGATTADKAVIWNQHNYTHNDRGSRLISVGLIFKGKTVWRRNNVRIEWKASQDTSVTVVLPPVVFDKVRVEVTEWQGAGGGLAEVEVFRGEENVVRGGNVTASGYLRSIAPGTQDYFQPRYLTDGMKSSSSSYRGYWCTPDHQGGWAEIEVGAAR